MNPGVAARKRFGQNFLHDPGVLARIVAAIAPARDDSMIEIGPGLGALTRPLLERVEHLEVVELDRDLIPHLRTLAAPDRLTIHSADALAFDFAHRAPGPGRLRVVGNLPYNISTPLLFHLLDQAEAIRDMHFLLQKEVVERLVAGPGSKRYGRLSVMLGARARAKQLFTVGPGAFRPAPKVESALVRIEPLDRPLVPPELESRFRQLVHQAFSNRRKTLRRALAGLLPPDAFAAAGVASGLRPEALEVATFIRLASLTAPGSNDMRPKPADSAGAQ
ncbi:Dimethyladenosine transferase [Thioalkalivibrio nitratireducens DSM 14787]|uniref:Ribosomal RNA small subunit methyltransferase A n=1 Tax=Thioalkalivibrio nitratireducens (strain DSM 14787 / UNIQEM 213 / ALEN2) TaxID=1255043 RepID=L0DY46_THIND|nr:16S rRNA (adenine(1518)-N(6)/adenine(1519)-N(6))-dimethyltransferase RsmA [Thioalkalivibrio nitratireducens]AGA33865.1 Dimethyladenosine transferase [Thioalkalivibrio nitratireducens DSM 14787]